MKFVPANLGYQVGLISFARVANVLRLARHLVEIHPRFLLRATWVLATAVGGVPLALWERLRHGRRIARTELREPPIFIVGHWRSGTTHLHNLMCCDPSFGFVSNYQAMVPDFSLVAPRLLRRVLSRVVPRKRPMDNMEWPMEAPQEEEIPLAKTMAHSFYAQFLFPRRTLDFLRRFVLLRGAPRGLVAEFRRKYRRVLQIASIHAGGKRLVLKNPVNTGRLPILRAMYPDAVFIHIHRSPYDVFASTRNLRAKLLSITTLQEMQGRDPDDTVLSLYEELMRRFLEDRRAIPAEKYAEVRFEDLERDPVGELRKIYSKLGLGGFERALPAVRAHLQEQRSYRKNRLPLTAEQCGRIERRWAFAFEAFGYARRTQELAEGRCAG